MTVLRSLGVSPEDLKRLRPRPSAPTFAEYVPRIYAALPATLTRDAYRAVAHAADPLEPDRGLAIGVAVLVESGAAGSRRWASKPRAAGAAAPWTQLVQAVPGHREEGGR
jgi:hypothetical protein